MEKDLPVGHGAFGFGGGFDWSSVACRCTIRLHRLLISVAKEDLVSSFCRSGGGLQLF